MTISSGGAQKRKTPDRLFERKVEKKMLAYRCSARKVKGSEMTGSLVIKLISTFWPTTTVGSAALSLYPSFSICTLVCPEMIFVSSPMASTTSGVTPGTSSSTIFL